MGWIFAPELSKKCEAFIKAHWGKDGLIQVKERPVSWVRHEANPHLKQLRRKRKRTLPLISVTGTVNRIHLALSTEKIPPPAGGRRMRPGPGSGPASGSPTGGGKKGV